MSTTTTSTVAPVKAAAKKSAVKKATPAATTKPEATKTPVKAVAKKAVVAKVAPATKVETPAKSNGLGKIATRVLQVLATSKTVLYKGVSSAGDLTYAAIAAEAGVAINNLTQTLSAQSKSGTVYANSLESLGFVKVNRYETPEGKQTPMLFSITAKGREALK